MFRLGCNQAGMHGRATVEDLNALQMNFFRPSSGEN
jgi:hypothetical protein